MDLQELYNRGYRRFKFSDGEVREPCDVKPGKHSQKLRFDVGPEIWYINDGRPNIGGEYPRVLGVAEDESMSEQGERSKRDEIQQAIEAGISEAVPDIDEHDEPQLIERIMHNLDSLVERWTDEETAEDLDKSIRESEVYEGMRVRFVGSVDDVIPYGQTGTIVHPDGDGVPAVYWDDHDYNTCFRPHKKGEKCNHATVGDLEKE